MITDNVPDAAAQAKPGLENRHELTKASKKANVYVFKVELILIPLSVDLIF